MKIYELLDSEKILCLSKVENQQDLFSRLVPSSLALNGKGSITQEEIIQQLMDREAISSTGIGNGIAIPHIRLDGLKEPVVRLAIVKEGLQFNAIDGKPCKIFFLFITPSDQTSTHLQILAKISSLLGSEKLRSRLEKADSPKSIYQILVDEENKGKYGYINLDKKSIFEELQTSENGLRQEEAKRRLEVYGPNVLKKIKKKPTYVKLLKNFISLFAILLWVGGGLCFIPGVDMPQLGWAIFGVIIINAVFSFWQEFKAERAIEALQKLLPQKSTVLRSGQKVEILASELVPGDIIFLEEGDSIPVDARLIESHEMRVNNAALTGESRPIYKMSEPIEDGAVLLWTELPNMVFAGTSVTSGSGRGVVIGTGMNTEIGKIAHMTQSVEKELSPLQKEMHKMVNIISFLAVGMGIIFFFLGKSLGGLSLIGAFIFTIGIVVANIPEGLLPTVSLALAMGVQRMAKRNVLIKQLSSVETLGCTNVICTDKTGTLTTNQISVSKIFINQRLISVSGTSYEPKGEFHDEQGRLINPSDLWQDPTCRMFFTSSVLCNNAHLLSPGSETNYWRIMGDPTEGSLIVLARKAGVDIEALAADYQRVGHLPFESIRKRMSTINQTKDGRKFAFTKGAPLETLAQCDSILINGRKEKLTPQIRQSIIRQNDLFAREGFRVLAVAYREDQELSALSYYSNEKVECSLTFLALVAMIDPPRAEVPKAIADCRTAGIRVIMITGDYGLTAKSIAHKIGMIENPDEVTVITGHELAEMDDQKLKAILKQPVIFARMSPDQKMRIVSCLKEEGYIVAVTGDGVNDAPALKKADIGVALGMHANDVAKEAANMIITDDNFASIVAGIEEGRAVYANIKRFVTYIFASNVPEIVPFILFVLFKIPLPLTVMQILAVDLGTDLVPALGLGVEAPEPGTMSRPPRPQNERMINTKLFLRAYGFLGMIEAILCMLGYYFIYWTHGLSWGTLIPPANNPAYVYPDGAVYIMATTMCLAGIVTAQVGNVFCCRTEQESIFKVGLLSNKLVLVGIITEITLILLFIYSPFFQKIFGLAPIGLKEWALLATFGPIILILEEGRKWLLRRRQKKLSPARARKIAEEPKPSYLSQQSLTPRSREQELTAKSADLATIGSLGSKKTAHHEEQ
ncbi:MAG: HAD-IC family P-type ATPase [bacterium]|nr:HAD-IC family P-type ATPase [bacterium]